MADKGRFSNGFLGAAIVLLAVVIAAVGWLSIGQGLRSGPELSISVGAGTGDEFERRVRAYLLENPEVIVEAMERLEARRRVAEVGEVQAMITSRSEQLLNDADSPVGANPDGDVTLVYFFDYNCPYCRRAAPMLAEAMKADSSLRFVFKEFPILGPGSEFAARAALASHRQGKYEAMHDAMMAHSGTIGEASTLDIAERLGLDIDRLKQDMEDPTIAAAIQRNLALARDLRINGTPGFVIGSEIVRGLVDLTTLQNVIKDARAQAGG